MANSVTLSRTGSFPVIPEKIEEFHKFVDLISCEGNLVLIEDPDNHFTILDGDNMQAYIEEEDDYVNALDYIAEHFLAPGGAMAFTWAGYEKLRFVGGGSWVAWKTEDGKVHEESMSTHNWIHGKSVELEKEGFKLDLPVS